MDSLRASMNRFNITPRFHPTLGAWGTTPSMVEVDLALSAHCLALEFESERLLWFSSDLVGDIEPLRDGHFRAVLEPSMDETNRRQFRGCLEDWRIDQFQLDVIRLAEIARSD